MTTTSIEWTDATWNPTRGCTMVSPGCQNCYAMRQAHRFSGKGQPYHGLTRLTKHGPVWTGKPRFVPEMLDVPLRIKKPTRFFVNSMGDLFHERNDFDDVGAVFGVMAACEQHTFQILTKYERRMADFFAERRIASHDPAQTCEDDALRHIDLPEFPPRPWPLPNVWIGVSAEDQAHADERWNELAKLDAAVRFISAEPLLGPITMKHWATLPDWIIVGGESGARARPCDVEWVRALVLECQALKVPIFVKQLGTRWARGPMDERGRYPAAVRYFKKGNDMACWPQDVRVQQFPTVRT
jgi:protein gp37